MHPAASSPRTDAVRQCCIPLAKFFPYGSIKKMPVTIGIMMTIPIKLVKIGRAVDAKITVVQGSIKQLASMMILAVI
jgi:hypothetical protein